MRRLLLLLALPALLLVACGDGDDDEPTRGALSGELDLEPSDDEPAEAAPTELPKVGDHIHQAYGVYACDGWVEPFVDGPEGDVTGIHAHGEGLIHVHPFTAEVSGANAVLDAFADTVDLTIGDDGLVLPDGTDVRGCGPLRAYVWDRPDDPEPTVVSTDVGSVPLRTDGAVIALVVAPEGWEVVQPASVLNLQDPVAAEEGRQPVVS